MNLPDRLSSLPESVIRHILSLMDAKYAVQTSVLSKKWKLQWAYLPSYTFELSTFMTTEYLEKFSVSLLNKWKPLNISNLALFLKGQWSLLLGWFACILH